MTNGATRRLLPLALGVSLTFNAAVMVGFMAAGGAGGPPRQPRPPMGPGLDLDRAAHVLRLSDEQKAKLAAVKDSRDRIFPALDEEAQLLEEDLHSELAKESADSAKVREILDRQAELAFERRSAQADLFEQFNQMLTPEQRRTLHEQRPQHQRPPHPPEVVKRFDRDNDGMLNPGEREAAEAEFRARREAGGPLAGPRNRPEGGRGEGGPPLWAFFDRDDDGQLNDDERAERDEFVRTHRPGRAWMRDGRREGPREGRPDARPEGRPEGRPDLRPDDRNGNGPEGGRPGHRSEGRPNDRPDVGSKAGPDGPVREERPLEPRPEMDENTAAHRPPAHRLR